MKISINIFLMVGIRIFSKAGLTNFYLIQEDTKKSIIFPWTAPT